MDSSFNEFTSIPEEYLTRFSAVCSCSSLNSPLCNGLRRITLLDLSPRTMLWGTGLVDRKYALISFDLRCSVYVMPLTHSSEEGSKYHISSSINVLSDFTLE